MDISVALKRFRKLFKITQAQAATLAGVSYRSYQGYEIGSSIPPASVIIALSIATGASSDFILGLSDTP